MIVFANVQSSAKPKDRATARFFGESPARLIPLEFIKGLPPLGLINVYFEPTVICPAPPRFPADTNVLAFLVADRAGGYRTVGLSYGAKLLTPDAVTAYKRRINDYLGFVDERNAETKILKITEWLVKCAEDPHTRNEGAAELVQRTSMRNAAITNHFGRYLTSPQMVRLSNAVFQAEFIGRSERLLLKLFEKTASTRIVQREISYLRKAAVMHPPIIKDTSQFPKPDDDSFPDGWCVFDTMKHLADVLDCPEAEAMLARDAYSTFFNASSRIAAVSKFLPVIEKAARQKGILLE